MQVVTRSITTDCSQGTPSFHYKNITCTSRYLAIVNTNFRPLSLAERVNVRIQICYYGMNKLFYFFIEQKFVKKKLKTPFLL